MCPVLLPPTYIPLFVGGTFTSLDLPPPAPWSHYKSQCHVTHSPYFWSQPITALSVTFTSLSHNFLVWYPVPKPVALLPFLVHWRNEYPLSTFATSSGQFGVGLFLHIVMQCRNFSKCTTNYDSDVLSGSVVSTSLIVVSFFLLDFSSNQSFKVHAETVVWLTS